MSKRVPVITVDGPAAVGKGTVARAVAQELGFHHLDSGRFYRAIGYRATQAGADLHDAAAVLAAGQPIMTEPARMEQQLADPALDSEVAGTGASKVAQLAAVRAQLNPVLLAWCKLPGVVADGRDMGTLVFTDAVLKTFLDADAATREARAAARAQGAASGRIADYLGEFRARNASDSSRTIAPIIPADDAVVIDTSTLDAAAVIQLVITLFRERQSA